MGRRKITIQQINDPKLRNITYNKRKNGLIKKAAEIALLCDINLLLVFEDLNGTLVQFSRDPIKNIANFPKSCSYKRVLELTADDYPDFSKIKRAKKKQEGSEEMSCQTSTTNAKKDSRSLMQMFSEHESIVDSEDVFTSDADIRIDYESLSNQVLDTPQTITDYTRETSSFAMSPANNHHQPEMIRKILKTSAIKLTQSQKNKAQKDSKKRANLRLNIPKTEDAVKDAVNAADSKGNKLKNSSCKKTGSSQKSYSRKSNFDYSQKKIEFTPPAFPHMMGMESHNQFNLGFGNMMSNSPFRDSATRKLRPVHNFMNEEELYNPNISNPNFSELGPFGYQMVGSTPPSQKYGSRYNEDEMFATDKIVNYLSHSGRTPPQHHNVFTFQQHEFYRNPESFNGFDHFNMMDNENNSSKRPSFHDLPLSSGYAKLESNNMSSNGMSGHRFNFDGYIFGNDAQKIKMI